jgi:mono/diheme cytochrome c family protein
MNPTNAPEIVAPPAEPAPVTARDPLRPPTVTRKQVAAMVGAVALLGVLYAGVSLAFFTSLKPEAPAADAPPRDSRELYAAHCANCHGARGEANGPASPNLNPPARHFGMERFRLASTTNGNPTDDDLMHVIQHGIPGSAMPPFPQLSEAERRSLVAEIRWRTSYGLRQKLVKSFESEGGADESELGALVNRLSAPGEPVAVPNPMPPTSAEAVARGRVLYAANCASCHGPEGRGDGPQVKDLKNENGHPTRPRDLTSGSYKGGGSPEQLYLRLSVGMPGTPMPASTTLKPTEICDLVHFVRSLAPPAAGNQ